MTEIALPVSRWRVGVFAILWALCAYFFLAAAWLFVPDYRSHWSVGKFVVEGFFIAIGLLFLSRVFPMIYFMLRGHDLVTANERGLVYNGFYGRRQVGWLSVQDLHVAHVNFTSAIMLSPWRGFLLTTSASRSQIEQFIETANAMRRRAGPVR